MSRAFTKERDDVPEPPVAFEPAAVRTTIAGRRALERAAAAAQPQERERLLARLDRVVVPAAPADPRRIGFGATVRVTEIGRGSERSFTIVGPDEIDIAGGRIGELSPLAQALEGRRAGQAVLWERPAGNVRLKITAVDYHADAPGQD